MEVARFMDKIDYLACPALDLGCSHVGAFHKEQLFLLRPTASLFLNVKNILSKSLGFIQHLVLVQGGNFRKRKINPPPL